MSYIYPIDPQGVGCTGAFDPKGQARTLHDLRRFIATHYVPASSERRAVPQFYCTRCLIHCDRKGQIADDPGKQFVYDE